MEKRVKVFYKRVLALSLTVLMFVTSVFISSPQKASAAVVSSGNTMQLLGSAFVNDPQDLSTKLDGSLSIPNPYKSVPNLDLSKGVKIQFDVEPTGTNRVLSTILSFMGNDGADGRLYFTPGSYLGYNATGGYFDANLQNYGMVTDYIGTSKATVDITFTPAGFEVDVNGVKAYDQSILSTSAGLSTVTDYYQILYWLNNTADKVYFGKGSWWGLEGSDNALCKISNVYFYGYLTPINKLMTSEDNIQQIASAYVNNPQNLSSKSDGSLHISNPYKTFTNLDVSKGVKIKFDVKSTGTKNALATIFSFMGNGGTDGRLYFTPGSYLGYNATGGWFDANLLNYGLATDYIGDSKSTVEISISQTGFEVDVNGVKAYDQTIRDDTSISAGTLSDYNNVLNWIANTADEVYFGKGSWWTDQIALCEISNVYFYGYIQDNSSPTVTLSETAVTYDGTAKTPAVTVNDGSTTLVEGKDYNITYTNNINVGTATVTIEGIGNYSGTITKSFVINAQDTSTIPIISDKVDVSTLTVALNESTFTYDGTAKTPSVTVKDGTTTLTAGTDYTVTYTDNINVGTAAKVTITGIGNYTGTTTKTFDIKVSASKLTVDLDKSTFTYDGTTKTPSVTVKYGSITLKAGTDYTVTYTDYTKVGIATITITGIGNYTGTTTKTFTITPKAVDPLTVTLGTTSYTFDGTSKTPTVKVNDGVTTLTAGTDYTVAYQDNANVGSAKVIITGAGNYTGTTTKTFTISAVDITSLEASLAEAEYTFDGTAKKPAVTVKDGAKTLVNGTDYTVNYKNSTKPGVATVGIIGKGNYTGVITKTFKIKPEVPSITLVAGSKSITINWDKLTNITGYNVYMSKSKKGTYKKIYSADSSTLSYTKTGLTAKKTYYFKIVAYTKSGDTIIYSDYSAISRAKTKK